MKKTHNPRFQTAALICAALFLALGTATAQTLTEDFKLTANDGVLGDLFGYRISVSGDTAAVGAYKDDDRGTDSGSVYIFVRNGEVWTKQAELTASDTTAGHWFGKSVSISGDTVIIGAPRVYNNGIVYAGSAYIFTRSNGIWVQQAKLFASDPARVDYFGSSVSISDNTAIVGVPDDDNGDLEKSGSVYIFVRINGVWIQQAKLTGSWLSHTHFGASVSVSGDSIVVGEPTPFDLGNAHVFIRTGDVWRFQATLIPSERGMYAGFGQSVSLSGDTAIVGSPGIDSGGISQSGGAFIFIRSGNTWTQQAKISANDAGYGDLFGKSVSISVDKVIVGASADDLSFFSTDTGSAYIFMRNNGAWIQQAKLVAKNAKENDSFGFSVSISDDIALIGAPSDIDSGTNLASAYVFDLVYHIADQSNDYIINLSELLRLIQFYNLGSLHCDPLGEDGFNPGPGDTTCTPHTSDYNPQNWIINFDELLRLIQLFNSLRYYSCPGTGEDGFCPGTP